MHCFEPEYNQVSGRDPSNPSIILSVFTGTALDTRVLGPDFYTISGVLSYPCSLWQTLTDDLVKDAMLGSVTFWRWR